MKADNRLRGRRGCALSRFEHPARRKQHAINLPLLELHVAGHGVLG
jgi:hypothetical protein